MADVATLIYEIDSSAARSAATDLAKLNEASARAAGGADKLNNTLRDSQGRFRSSHDVAKQYGAEVQSLAAKYNPALNAVYRYQAAQIEVNRAVALGVLTQGQADAALERVSSELSRAAEMAQGYASGMQTVGNVQGSVGNQFAQLNDVVVTAWGGMNPALIGMQQGMQMVQGFAGQSLPQALGTLRGAFAQLLNPLTLVAIGAVAGGAALIQLASGAIGASDASKTLDDRLSDLENQISAIDQLNRFSSVGGIEAMGEAYGRVTDEIRELIAAQRFAAAELAKADLAGIIKEFENETGTTFWQSWFGDTSGGVMVSQSIIDAENRINNLQSALSLTTNDARSLGFAMDEAFKAESLEDQISKLATVRQYLTLIAKAGGDGAGEAARMLGEIIKAEDAARKLLAASGQLPGSFASAAAAAVRITDELNRAVSAASRLAASAVSDMRFAQIELDFRTDEIGKAGAIAAAKFDAEIGKNSKMDQWLYNSLRQQAIDGAKETARIMGEVRALDEADREAAKGDGGGRSGARELAAAERGFQSLRELLDRETMFQYAEWERRQAQLDVALNNKLISEQNYHLMREQLQMMYFGTEYERNALNYQMDLEQLNAAFEAKLLSEQQYLMRRNELQHQYYSNAIAVDQNASAQTLSQMADSFSQMNSLAGGGYDSLLRAQRTFAAGSALINAYLAASQALADPTVPFWQKFAAYAKVLAAGMGAVNAIKGSGGGGRVGGSAASSAKAATKKEPQRNILVRLEGPDFMVDMAESIMTQIYEASRDGRVIISRDR